MGTNLRNRYDEKGNCIGSHRMLYDGVPDDYAMKSIFGKNDKYKDLSYLATISDLKSEYADKNLKEFDLGIEFQNEEYVRNELFFHMSLDYLNSARYMWKAIIFDRGQDMVSHYVIPCAYLCKHSIELMIKTCMLKKRGSVSWES